MARLWFVAAAAVVVLVWLFFLRTVMALVVPGLVVAGLWIWWEVRELRRAIRTPPKS